MDRSHRLRPGRLAGGNVDTPRSISGVFANKSPSFMENWRGGKAYLRCKPFSCLKTPPLTFPGPQSRPLHRSAAHQRTFIRDPTAHKARLLIIETAGSVRFLMNGTVVTCCRYSNVLPLPNPLTVSR